MNSLHGLLLSLLCVLGIACGQVLFKKAALTLGEERHWLALATSGWLLAALILYGAATLLWVMVLRTTPLTLAYPLFALSFLLVPLLAWLLLGEPLRPATFYGGLLILAGVVVSTRGGAG